VFLTRRDAEPTNIDSGRNLRPSVISRQVTNGFRSTWGAKTCADRRSMRRHRPPQRNKPPRRHPRRPRLTSQRQA
jgi:hypothetical protein